MRKCEEHIADGLMLGVFGFDCVFAGDFAARHNLPFAILCLTMAAIRASAECDIIKERNRRYEVQSKTKAERPRIQN